MELNDQIRASAALFLGKGAPCNMAQKGGWTPQTVDAATKRKMSGPERDRTPVVHPEFHTLYAQFTSWT